jgi:hypothetical protein
LRNQAKYAPVRKTLYYCRPVSAPQVIAATGNHNSPSSWRHVLLSPSLRAIAWLLTTKLAGDPSKICGEK